MKCYNFDDILESLKKEGYTSIQVVDDNIVWAKKGQDWIVHHELCPTHECEEEEYITKKYNLPSYDEENDKLYYDPDNV